MSIANLYFPRIFIQVSHPFYASNQNLQIAMVKKNCKLIKFFKYFIKAMRGITVILDWSRAIQSPESRWPKSSQLRLRRST